MNGPTTRYREALAGTPGPVDPFAQGTYLDVHALLAHARERGMRADELPPEEAEAFVRRRPRGGAEVQAKVLTTAR